MDSFSYYRTHRPGTITSRHSSISSMKFSSKPSILSTARVRDPSISLSTSRSRRLRTSGSIKNGQASPMFPAAGSRKRGGGLENPEPSSPKVTCIGQVRVKTKKKGKKMQTLSRRRSAEVSFRRTEHARHNQIQRQSSVNSQYQQHQEFSSHRNQRWVHLPLTICETLRGFGSEFSCLFPCKSSCFSESSEREKGEEKVEGKRNDGGQSPCGALFGRWLVAVQDDSEGGKGRDIEAVVGGGDEEEGERPIRSARRHVFDEIEIKDDIFELKVHEGNDMEGGEGRESLCIPPKNALLLMRCRSDPVKMEALVNRFWEPHLPKQDEEEEEEEEEEERENKEDNNNRNKEETVSVEMIEVKDDVEMVQKENLEQVLEEGRDSVSVDINEEQEEENQPEAEASLEMDVQDNKQNRPIEDLRNIEELQDGEEKQDETEEKETLVEEENELGFTALLEALADDESEEDDENDPIEDKNEDESRVSYSNASFSLQSDLEISEPDEEEEEELAEEVALELEYSMESTVEKETHDKTLEVKLLEKVTQEGGGTRKTEERETERIAVVERESEAELKEKESSSRLPDSLLLMMCESKLSMEVSKETWVCSTDFIRWKPPVQVKQTDGGDHQVDADEPTNTRVSVDSHSVMFYHQPPVQPPRSSCCLPAKAAAVSMATMIEQKLVSAVAYEPFVLTRCKSAPTRTASKKVAPDACFWKNRTLEPHRRATFGVGAAEVGF